MPEASAGAAPLCVHPAHRPLPLPPIERIRRLHLRLHLRPRLRPRLRLHLRLRLPNRRMLPLTLPKRRE